MFNNQHRLVFILLAGSNGIHHKSPLSIFEYLVTLRFKSEEKLCFLQAIFKGNVLVFVSHVQKNAHVAKIDDIEVCWQSCRFKRVLLQRGQQTLSGCHCQQDAFLWQKVSEEDCPLSSSLTDKEKAKRSFAPLSAHITILLAVQDHVILNLPHSPPPISFLFALIIVHDPSTFW
ncbi:hypothetical protein CEXT_370141 [Caerostris extrusa]|uniref:Uncharacterized protein n=1 Tax=Caerostris extrusa TaxID=172846 RepID=A0AAV4NDV3_CAEEX|nr:hypothetical protein CEXT_370141 [Caerostris extrusa]